MKWLIVLLFFILLFVAGCEKKITEKELNSDLERLRIKSAILCKDKNMGYVAVEMVSMRQSQAVCMINSPPKIYRFGVEK